MIVTQDSLTGEGNILDRLTREQTPRRFEGQEELQKGKH